MRRKKKKGQQKLPNVPVSVVLENKKTSFSFLIFFPSGFYLWENKERDPLSFSRKHPCFTSSCSLGSVRHLVTSTRSPCPRNLTPREGVPNTLFQTLPQLSLVSSTQSRPTIRLTGLQMIPNLGRHLGLRKISLTTAMAPLWSKAAW